jgi:hypothetical protein
LAGPQIHLPRWVWVRLRGRELDGRLAAGEDPWGDAVLACRAARLVSRRMRRTIVHGLERLLSERARREVFSAAVSCDWQAVEVARPALEQLARALRSRDSLEPRGIALTHILLTEPLGALYRPARVDELYEVAREALFALGTDEAAGRVWDREGQLRRSVEAVRVARRSGSPS